MLVLVLLGSAYGVARAGLDLGVQIAIVSGLLIALAVLAYFGVRAGRSAPFVVTAILLPYALGAVVASGSAQRLASGMEDLFETDPDVLDYDEDWDEDWEEEPVPE